MKGGWAMQTCVAVGLPSLAWRFSPHRGLAATIILEEEMTLRHSFVTTWLQGSLRSQLQKRTDEGKVLRSGRTVSLRAPPKGSTFPSFRLFLT